MRLADAVAYEARRIAFDFDMIQSRWDQSLSPGNEQAFYWSSAAADGNGSRNYMGLKSAAADAMIAALLTAQTRDEVVAAVRALDRVLISGFYRGAAVPCAGAMDRALDPYPASGRDLAARIHSGNLVACGRSKPMTRPM